MFYLYSNYLQKSNTSFILRVGLQLAKAASRHKDSFARCLSYILALLKRQGQRPPKCP